MRNKIKSAVIFTAIVVFGIFIYQRNIHAETPVNTVGACPEHVPYGQPHLVTPSDHTTILCRKAYMVEHDNVAKIPVWVSYVLTPEHTIGCVTRTNSFMADPQLPIGQRAELSDYRKSGYDIGHNANDADMSWDVQAEHESFLLSNMSPQLPSLNRGRWKQLENYVRAWAYVYKQPVVVYVGNIYSTSSATIGNSKVTVPDSLYKIIINTVTGENQAFMMPNVDDTVKNVWDYQVTIADVEKETGLVFPVPDDKLAGTKTNMFAPWVLKQKSVMNQKRDACELH